MPSERTEVGVSRVVELENLLGEVLDVYREGTFTIHEDSIHEVEDLMDRIGRSLEDSDYDGDECD